MLKIYLILIVVLIDTNCSGKLVSVGSPVGNNSALANTYLANASDTGEHLIYNHAEKERLLWAGSFEDYSFRWTTSGFYVADNGNEREILAEYATNWFQQISPDQKDCKDEITVRLVSVVGPIATFEFATSILCERAANISSQITWITVDLRKPGVVKDIGVIDPGEPTMNTSLLDIYPEATILAALLSNPLIKKALGGKSKVLPTTLEDVWEGGFLKVRKKEEDNNLLTKYSLNQFKFQRLEANKVVVALELLDVHNPRMGKVESIEIMLPFPANLTEELSNASKFQNGFLGFHEHEFSKNDLTVFIFRI